MAKNMMNSNHKATNGKHRYNFDRIFPIEKSESETYKRFRKPTAPPTKAFKDKSKYHRKVKHKTGYSQNR